MVHGGGDRLREPGRVGIARLTLRVTVHARRVAATVAAVDRRVFDGVRRGGDDSATLRHVSELRERRLRDEVVHGAAGVRHGHRVAVGRAVLHDASLAHAASTHHTEQVLVELLREERVQEGVGARVEREEEDEEDLRLGDGDERVAERGGEAEERDREETREVGEDEQRHALGDVGVVRADDAIVDVHLAVHVEVARADGDESGGVDEEQGEDVHLVDGARRLHRQADARLAVAAHPDERQGGHEQGEHPPRQQDGGRLAQPQPLGEVDGVADGVPPLHRDDGEREDRVAGGEDGEEARHLTAALVLPGDGEVEVDALRVQVDGGQQ